MNSKLSLLTAIVLIIFTTIQSVGAPFSPPSAQEIFLKHALWKVFVAATIVVLRTINFIITWYPPILHPFLGITIKFVWFVYIKVALTVSYYIALFVFSLLQGLFCLSTKPLLSLPYLTTQLIGITAGVVCEVLTLNIIKIKRISSFLRASNLQLF